MMKAARPEEKCFVAFIGNDCDGQSDCEIEPNIFKKLQIRFVILVTKLVK